MTNPEFIQGFDILWNNTTSNQAPDLNNKEISFFLNKAQLEVLKNHLNPKGNKYLEGFDNTSKRQVEFWELVKEENCTFPSANFSSNQRGNFNRKHWLLDDTALTLSIGDVLSIVNESVDVVTLEDYKFILEYEKLIESLLDFEGSELEIVRDIIDLVVQQGVPNDSNLLNKLIEVRDSILISNAAFNAKLEEFKQEFVTNIGLEKIAEELYINIYTIPVIPLSHDEYDLQLSKPYKYPPKSQAWRITLDGNLEVVVEPDKIPIWYKIRYIETPSDIDVDNDNKPCMLPEVLHDEVLQRAVELAKISWLGDLNSTLTGGQRSE